ncbi:MAG: 2Fe-2S iron-sulfur cluster-binding protein [bacterium]
MMDTINVTLNGAPVIGSKGMTILELAKQNGIEIPTLCFMEGMSPTGSCRMCVVEVKGSRTLVASCHTPIQPDMDIQTHSPKVLKARRTIIELLLANHTDNCLMCDKANMCELRLIAADLEIGLSRFKGERHFYPLEEELPNIIRDLSKCILCRRCIRFCFEKSGKSIFNIANRGFESKVVADPEQQVDESIYEECVDICPVGALSKKISTKKKGTPLTIKG